MLLRANLDEISLANVVRLVTIGALTGVLALTRPGRRGDLYFRDGTLYFAAAEPPTMFLGERLVRAGVVTEEHVAAALAEQRAAAGAPRLGAILISRGLLDRGMLAEAVADQIEETAFALLAWTEGQVEFVGGATREEDIIVELSFGDVTTERSRQVADRETSSGALESPQHVPQLTPVEPLSRVARVSLSLEEWRVASVIDGRRDIAAVLEACGLDRAAATEALHRLRNTGLVAIPAMRVQERSQTAVVLVRGSIDFYVDTFLSSLGGEMLTHHPLSEVAGDDVGGMAVRAVRLPPEEEGEETVVVGASAASPPEAWLQAAVRCAACVLLVNANSVESVRGSQADLDAVRMLPDLPVTVLSYVSVSDEGLDPAAVRGALGLGQEIVVMPCDLRDHGAAVAAVRRALRPRAV